MFGLLFGSGKIDAYRAEVLHTYVRNEEVTMKRLLLSTFGGLALSASAGHAPASAQETTYANVICKTVGGVEDCVLNTGTTQTPEGCQKAADDSLANLREVLARAYCVTGRGTEWSTIGPAYGSEAWAKLHPPGSAQPPMAQAHLPTSESKLYAKVGNWKIHYYADSQSCIAGTAYGNKDFSVTEGKGAIGPYAMLIGGDGVNGLAADHDFPVFAKFNNGTSPPVHTSGTVKVLDQDKFVRFALNGMLLQNFMLAQNMELYAETKAGPRLLLMGALEGTREAMKKLDSCRIAYGLDKMAPSSGPIARGAPADPNGVLPPN